MTKYGYARASTRFQIPGEDSLGAQVAALVAAGCTVVCKDRMTLRRGDRSVLERLLRLLGSEDLLVVGCLDRLSETTSEILEILARVQNSGAVFRSLGEGWADTTVTGGRLTTTIIDEISDFEVGLEQTRFRRVSLIRPQGRPRKLSPQQRQEALNRRALGETLVRIARDLDVHHTTISRLTNSEIERLQGTSSDDD